MADEGDGGGCFGDGKAVPAVDMAVLLQKAEELDLIREEQAGVFAGIEELRKALADPRLDEESGDAIILELRSLFARGKELADSEADTTAAYIGLLEAFQESGKLTTRGTETEASAGEKKMAESDPDITSLPLGSMASQPEQATNSLDGEKVAARITPDDAEKTEWIVVKVIHFEKETEEFEVSGEDLVSDGECSHRNYKIPRSRIIPFPKRNDPSGAPDILPGRSVLAVYPGTTTLYKATVVHSHRQSRIDDYLLEFDEDEEKEAGCSPQKIVPFDKVVLLPKEHSQ